MNAYRQQQLQAAALIDSGDYTAEQIAELYGWTKSRAAPKQSETGDKRTLTPRRKCGIIKAIVRCFRRKRKIKEEKKMKEFEKMLAGLEHGTCTTTEIENAAYWKLPDGSTIETYSLGRDGGFDIIGRDPNSSSVCYICTDSGYSKTGKDFDEIADTIKDGAQTLEQVFDMWENGLGGDPFDLDYMPNDYK